MVIDADALLGITLSSARHKREIEAIGARSEGLLKLRLVTFAYKQDGPGVRQYGLIAEKSRRCIRNWSPRQPRARSRRCGTGS